MATKEQSVTQLRRNKRALVDSFNHIGFDSVSVDTRASLFPQLVKWGHGLLDVCIAACRKSDGRRFYFTLTEWQSLSADEQSTMLMRGIRIRAHGKTLIMSLYNVSPCVWGGRTAVSYSTSFNLNNNDNLHCDFWNSRAETELIANYLKEQNIDGISGAPALDAALNYRAFTKSIDGLDDDTQWALPSFTALRMIYRYRNEINAVLGAIGAEQIRNLYHWTVCSADNNNAYRLNMGNGLYGTSQKNTVSNEVRPVAFE